jgi:ABC-type Fe3+-hydroxamate transport system substrate-binding protein
MYLKIHDQLLRVIELQQPPKRIVSVVPSQTELLFGLGVSAELIVGVTKFCIHPEAETQKITKIGGTKQLDAEKIKSLKPDLILANKEENTKEQIELLVQVAPVWISDVVTLENALEMIAAVGQLTGTQQKAQSLVSTIGSSFDKLPKRKPLRVAYYIWKGPYMVAGGGTFIDNLLREVGFENVFAEKHRYPAVLMSDLAEASPEVILLSDEPYPFKPKHLEQFKAVCPQAQVVLVRGDMFSWYGSRLLETPNYINELWRILAPTLRH